MILSSNLFKKSDLTFNMCFGMSISSPFFLDTLSIPLQHLNSLKNAKNKAQTHNVLTLKSAVIKDPLIQREPHILFALLRAGLYDSQSVSLKCPDEKRLEMLILKHMLKSKIRLLEQI